MRINRLSDDTAGVHLLGARIYSELRNDRIEPFTSSKTRLVKYMRARQDILLRCAWDIPNQVAYGDALAHALVRLESSTARKRDTGSLIARKCTPPLALIGAVP